MCLLIINYMSNKFSYLSLDLEPQERIIQVLNFNSPRGTKGVQYINFEKNGSLKIITEFLIFFYILA